jgi:hypothetical protein
MLASASGAAIRIADSDRERLDMTWWHAALALALAVPAAACGSSSDDDPVVVQPAGCVEGLEHSGTAPEPGSVRVGDAWFVGLEQVQRLPWRALRGRDGTGRAKAGVIVPAGQTLVLSVPPVSRGLLALDYTGNARRTNRATMTACHGRFPTVFFPGSLLVRRPLCRLPLDWRYGDERGRLLLSFGRAC